MQKMASARGMEVHRVASIHFILIIPHFTVTPRAIHFSFVLTLR